MKSTSFHKVTSDRGTILYKIIARLIHTPFNYINNLNANKNIDPNIKTSYFQTEKLEEQYPKLEPLSSPSRKLSDLFWMNTDWNDLQNKFNQINICDLGCDSGNYFLKLQDYSNQKINKYFGLDIYENENWKILKSEHLNTDFRIYNGTNIIDLIPKDTNLIISQSAIEHFSEDITVFKQLSDFANKSDHSVYQIHLFPSKACLKLYPFHGIRQYTPRNISKITRLFNNNSNIELIELGGEYSNQAHAEFINTGYLKRDLRKKNIELYESICFNAIKNDLEKKQTDAPDFYALVIKTVNK